MRGKRVVAIALLGSLLFSQSIGTTHLNIAKTNKIETITIYKGKSTLLKISQKGKKIKTGKKYRYQVAKKRIATISKSGKVKAKKAGTTNVVLQKKSNKKKIKIKIKVVDYVKELRISSATNMMMKVGEKKNISATVYPATAKSRKVQYSCSDTRIATVNASGMVQTLQSGMATITVKTKEIAKNGKKISKKIYLMVTEDSSPVPTPYIPVKDDTVIGGSTIVVIPTPTPSATVTPGGDITPTPTGATPTSTATVIPTPTATAAEPPKTLEEAIKAIPSPSSSTLIAANFVVKNTKGISTLYFINRNYQGQMHVSVDGIDLSSSNTVVYNLHRLATEVTGGFTVSVNPGDKKENKYYDTEWGLWRDILAVNRPTLSDAWLITNRRDGTSYRMMAWETDQLYGTPYGLIITEGDTSSKIKVY